MGDIVVEVITNIISGKALATNERSICTVNCTGYFHCYLLCWRVCAGNRLVGLVVKASASRAEDPGFESRLPLDFFGVESYQ